MPCHPLVSQLWFTRSEFVRCLEGVTTGVVFIVSHMWAQRIGHSYNLVPMRMPRTRGA